jgi:adenine deaminase
LIRIEPRPFDQVNPGRSSQPDERGPQESKGPRKEGWTRLRLSAVRSALGRSKRVGRGLLKDFNLRSGGVASSVGHDAHNIIIAGTKERDVRVALETIKAKQGGVVVADGTMVVAMIELPVAGLLSDKPAREVQAETSLRKRGRP